MQTPDAVAIAAPNESDDNGGLTYAQGAPPVQAAHPLDRPVWNALRSRQAHLAETRGGALRIRPVFGIFAAAEDDNEANQADLAALARIEGVGVVETRAWPTPPGLVAETHALAQMVSLGLTPAPPPAFEIVPLTDADAPDMLELARLTKPGPFFSRTHELGDFIGVKENGQLIAMAGERLKLPGFTEVSGVCTRPGHRGKGYAAALMRIVAGRIVARGATPFLHAYAHNTGAIGLYETLGFQVRRVMTLTALSRPSEA